MIIESLGDISSPLITMFLLGLVFVLDPCTIFANIAAIGYISADCKNRKRVIFNYLFFILGRVLMLFLLGVALMFLLEKSIFLLNIRDFIIEYSQIIVPVFLFSIGFLLLFSDKIRFFKIELSTQKIKSNNINISLQSFLLGGIISILMCPSNFIIFFGVILPFSITSQYGAFLPLIFAISSTLPIVLIMIVMIFGINSVNRFFNYAEKLNRYIIQISGIIFLLAACYFLIEHFILHNH